MSDGKPQTCPYCGSENLQEKTTNAIDVGVGPGIPCESEISCGSCKAELGYWAYGSYLPNEQHPNGLDFDKLTMGERRNLLHDLKEHGIETIGELKRRRQPVKSSEWGSW